MFFSFYESFPDRYSVIIDEQMLDIDLRRADIAAGEGLSAALIDLVYIAAEEFRLILFRQFTENARCWDKGSGGIKILAGDEVGADLQTTAAL